MLRLGKNRTSLNAGADMADESDAVAAEAEKTGETPDRRALIKKLGKAALLPALVATFVATDATDAAAT
jgi:hypothetical protein